MTETAIPRHPSNRKIIEQMMLWGWALGKRDGKWQQMIGAPIGSTAGMTLAVAAATQHDANPTAIFLEIYKLTTGGDGEQFWEGPPDPKFWADTVAQARLREKRRRDEEQADALAKAAEAAQRRAIQERAAQRRQERVSEPEPITPKGLPKSRKPRKEEPMSSTLTKVNIRSTDVFNVLVNNDRPMNTAAIAKEMPVEATARNIRDINNRCVYLANRGLAVRVLNGTYRATQQGHAIAARIQHDVGTQASLPSLPRATEAPPAPAPTVNHVVESIDDTIEAVLDLLLPAGFRAADLRFIAPWVETTKSMIAQVQRT